MTAPLSKPDRFIVPDEDPAFKYRWFNKHDRRMVEAQYEGWDPVVDKDGSQPLTIPSVLQPGQSTNNPTGGVVRLRGDLVLMKMPREAWEKNIRAGKEEARAAQEAGVDTEAMIERADDNARRALRNLGYRNLPKRLVFEEDIEDPLVSGKVTKPGE